MTTDLQKETLDFITKNWTIYRSLVETKIKTKEVREPLLVMCDKLHDRISTCPASTKTEYIGAYPGGLVEHSLNILKIMTNLNKIYKTNISPDSLVVTGLFHDLGKIGNTEENYYIIQDSEWHRNKGFIYTINPKIADIPAVVRSIYWLNLNNVLLSEQEIHAILSLRQINQMYSQELYNVPPLTLVLQEAVRASIVLKKIN